jgi:DNA repair exonuclease SbcCD nuclease subunit
MPSDSFRYIHAADLHLDSPFVGLGRLQDEYAGLVQELRRATFKAFEAVIELCLREKVDFLLVAGDVYDGADRSLQAQLEFREGLKRLSDTGIRSFVVHGNHDPLDGWAHSLEMPELAHIFGSELESVVFEKSGQAVARIHGISYPKRVPGKTFGKGMKRSGDEPFQIGLLHCNAGGNTDHDPYAPRSVSELVDAEMDYWALGHIHERSMLNESEPFIGYPGNTQGRHVNEDGPRGCFLVEVSQDGKLAGTPEFVPTDAVRWQARDVTIADLESVDDLLGRLEELMDELVSESDGRSVVARVHLVGRGPLHALLAQPDDLQTLLERLQEMGAARSPFVWIEKLKRQTQPDVDMSVLRAAPDFLGDLLGMIEEIRHSPDELASLSGELADLFEHKRARRLLTLPDEMELRQILDQAEICCVDLLTEDEA